MTSVVLLLCRFHLANDLMSISVWRLHLANNNVNSVWRLHLANNNVNLRFDGTSSEKLCNIKHVM